MRYPQCRGTIDAAGVNVQRPGNAGHAGGSGAARLTARFPGRCTKCRANVAEGERILFADRQIVGCAACSPGEVMGIARTREAANAAAALNAQPTVNAWDGLLNEMAANSALAMCMRDALVLPPSVEQCSAIPLPAHPPDEHQLRVIRWRTGEAVAAAAAGSGKSFSLTERVAALVREGCAPEQVLTLVYNRKAADDLRPRVQQRLGWSLGSRAQVFTFHGFAYALINEWWPGRFGRGRVIGAGDDGPSALTLGRRALGEADINEDDCGLDLRNLIKASELVREALIPIDDPDVVIRVRGLPLEQSEITTQSIIRFTRAYQRVKASMHCIDFADMLYLVNQVIALGGTHAKQLATRYAHVQVDEAQDINPARANIAKHLAQGARSLVWVGDFRQTIYSFTGSRPDLLQERIDEGAELLTLPVNRRSSQHIVEAGNRIANGRSWNVGGECQPAPENVREDAEPVRIWMTESGNEEADTVAREIQARVEAGLPLANAMGKANYAALVRTNSQAADLELAFTIRNLPCRVIGVEGGVWASSVGRDFLAYLRAATGTPDADLARVANKPKRFLKRNVVEDAVQQARMGADLIEVLRRSNNRNAQSFANDLEFMRGLEWSKLCAEVLRTLLKSVEGDDIDTPDEDRAESYRALTVIALQFGSVAAIDQQIEQMKKVNASTPAVEICTMHRAKGAEWEIVFVCGAARGILPHRKATNIEEECRLFYVAVTRGRSVVIVSVGATQPSPFLAALDGRIVVPAEPVRRPGVDSESRPTADDEEDDEEEDETPAAVPQVSAVPPIVRRRTQPATPDAPVKRASARDVAEFAERFRTRGSLNSQE